MEHRAHYLQQFVRSEARYPNTRGYTLYASTCDCGWYSGYHSDSDEAMRKYSEHVNYMGPVNDAVDDSFNKNIQLQVEINKLNYKLTKLRTLFKELNICAD